MTAAPDRPQPYRWPAGKRCAVVFSADIDGESPLAWNNRGQDFPLLAEVETRRFGPRVGVWRLIDLLAEFGARGSFFVPGRIAELYPHLLPALVKHGHEVGLHGYHHERVNEMSAAENADILDRSLARFAAQIGPGARGYRSPSWELTPIVIALLKERGILYDSSLSSFDHPYSIGGLVEIPAQWLIEDSIYFRFTGSPRDRTHPANPADVLAGWIEEFEGMREVGGLFTITVHPWVSGRAQRIRFLRALFAHIASRGDVWWTTAAEIAAWHRTSPNAQIHAIDVVPLDTNL